MEESKKVLQDTNELLNMKTKKDSGIPSKNQTFTIDPEEENISKLRQSFMYEAEILKLKKEMVETYKIMAEQLLEISSLQKSLEESQVARINETIAYEEEIQELLAARASQGIQLNQELKEVSELQKCLKAQLKERIKLLEEGLMNKRNALEQYEHMRRLKQEKMDLNKALTIAVKEIKQAQADRDKMSEQLSEALSSNEKLQNEEKTLQKTLFLNS